MFRFRRGLLDFRSSKLTDEYTNFIARNPIFDHVAVDVGALAGAAGRMTRDLLGAERDQETVKFMSKTVFNTALRRVQAKKSVALLMDGSDPLWKIRKSRKYPGKKFEGKFYRSAASPASYMVEDKLRIGMFEQKGCPPEVVISGPACMGPVESKLGAWMLDLADRDDVTRNDSFAIIGGADLALSALGATPFHNITNLQFSQDWRALTLQDTLEWLGVDQILKDDDNMKLARVRTDVVLLQLLAGGITTTDLPSLGLGFKEMMEVYASDNLPNAEFLFSEDGNQLLLDATALERLLSKASRRTHPARPHAGASDYLEVLLQTHVMLCGGGIRNYGYIPKEPLVEKPVPVRVEQLLGVLKMHGKAKLRASEDFNFGLTAAEFLLVSAPTASLIDQIIPAYTGGHPLPPGTSEEIVACDSIGDAVKQAREILDRGSKDTHPAMDFYPSHCFVRTPGEKGPPAGYRYHCVNLGVRSFDNLTRSRLNSESATDAVVSQKTKNAMVVFDAKDGKWVATSCSALPKDDGATYPKELKVLTWNVQFNRHSGEKTPLGKPGIDWCSDTRYIALADVLEREGADIVAMQEAEAPWWEHLAAQKFVQDNYYLTSFSDGEAITPWGVLLMVKKTLIVSGISNANVAGYTGHTSVMPVVTVSLKKAVKLAVGSFHLLAPYNQNNISNRTTQIENLVKRLQAKAIGTDCIAMGDFNDYPEQFYTMPEELQLGDAWVEVKGNDGEAGYTINGKVSAYTNLIIEPEYFGRADRMFYRSKHLQPIAAKIVGDVSVKQQFAANGKAGLLEGKKCPDYLFPSDHFGCCVTFAVK